MKKQIKLFIISILLLLPFFSVDAQEAGEQSSQYFKAEVVEILSNQEIDDSQYLPYENFGQKVKVRFLEGEEKGTEMEMDYYPKSYNPAQMLSIGEKVYVMKVNDGNNIYYGVSDRYRLDVFWYLIIVFVLLAIVVGKWKGLGALLGLAFSILVIVKFMIPYIMAGHNPLWVCFVGSMAIALFSIYIAHGFNKRTSLAVVSTILIIMVALGIDYLVINLAGLFGTGTEEAVFAQFGENGPLNLRGLLLGGIIVGVLGVLDDITTAQAAVVDELYKANPSFNFKELYNRAISVGKEHIASLINTLVLAYVGASFPLVLLFQKYEQPLAYILNSELVAEEIARTLIGSISLILAVPLTTALSAFFIIRSKDNKKNSNSSQFSNS